MSQERDWKLIRKLWENNELSYTELSKVYEIPLSTIKRRKRVEGWVKVHDTYEMPLVKAQKRVELEVRNKHHEKEHLANLSNALSMNEAEKKFAEEFVRHHNAFKAYKIAFGAPPTSHALPYKLLNKKAIKTYVEELMNGVSQSFALQMQGVMEGLTEIGFSDITDFVNIGNRDGKSFVELKNPEEWTGSARVIQEVKIKDGEISVKLYDRLAALKELKDFFAHIATDDIRQLQKEKLEAEIAILKKGMGSSGAGGVVIVNNTDEMKKIMEERAMNQIQEIKEVES